MTFDQGAFDHEEDKLDPVIAERFQQLERVPVPDYRAKPSAGLQVDEPRVIRRPLVALAAAAALTAVVGISIVSLRPKTELEVNATDQPNAEADASAGEASPDGGTEELTVELPSSTNPLPSGQETDGSSITSGTSPDADAPDDAGQDEEPSTGQASDQTSSPTTTIVRSEDLPTTTEPPTVTTAPETSPSTTSAPQTAAPTSPPDTVDLRDRITTLRGIVDEVFTDCQSHLILNEEGKIDLGEAITCDGGSYIVIDGRRIMTSSGYVPQDLYYDRHLITLRPGQSIVVSAVPSPYDASQLTLGCARCGISLGG